MRTIEKKSLKVGKFVNAAHVSNLIRNYKKERWMQNSENLGKEDTLGIWFSTEELEEFIQTAKMNGAEGVRICFGVYGENAPSPEMEGKQTVALVATTGEKGNSDSHVQKDLYAYKNGKPSLVAYNSGLGWPWDIPGGGSGSTLGTVIVTDKDKGLRVI